MPISMGLTITLTHPIWPSGSLLLGRFEPTGLKSFFARDREGTRGRGHHTPVPSSLPVDGTISKPRADCCGRRATCRASLVHRPPPPPCRPRSLTASPLRQQHSPSPAPSSHTHLVARAVRRQPVRVATPSAYGRATATHGALLGQDDDGRVPEGADRHSEEAARRREHRAVRGDGAHGGEDRVP